MNLEHAESMAKSLMRRHGLMPSVPGDTQVVNHRMEPHWIAIAGKWKFQFDNAKVRFGQCDYNKHTIKLSRALVELNDEDRVRDTILHEIAHALAGPRAKHGRVWQRWCREVGIEPRRCYSEANTKTVKGKYTFACPAGHEVSYHRLPKLARSCFLCHPAGYNVEHRLMPVGLSAEDQKRFEMVERTKKLDAEMRAEVVRLSRKLR